MLLRILILATFICFALSDKVVTTKAGSVSGTTVTPGGEESKCDVFYAIPFAKAERFERPQPADPWSGIRSAASLGPQCVNMPGAFNNVPPSGQSEDCLNLDITLPPGHALDGPAKPVMVWIHGGGFLIGNAAPTYAPLEICRNFGPQDVVVVELQYRLGSLGFLALPDEGVQGNFGLWDLLEGLKWVKANIAAFGGDPEQVTIFGESAGGAAVSHLTYAPAAEPYFARAIAQSGNSEAHWAGSGRDAAERTSRVLLEKLHCEDVACLRAAALEDLLAAEPQESFHGPSREPGRDYVGGGHSAILFGNARWCPRTDGDLLPGEDVAIAQMKPKTFITGTNSQESFMMLRLPFLKSWSPLAEYYEQRVAFRMIAPKDSVPFYVEDDDVAVDTFVENLQDAAEIFLNDASQKKVHSPNLQGESACRNKVATAIARMAKFVYLDQQDFDGSSTEFTTGRLLDLFSDLGWHLPVLLDASRKARRGWTVWLYNYDHAPESVPPPSTIHKGASHADELYALFSSFGFGPAPNLTAADLRVRAQMMRLWGNFARHGNPSFGEVGALGLKWSPFQSLEKPLHLRIAEESSMSEDFHSATMPFWLKIAPQIRDELKGKKEL